MQNKALLGDWRHKNFSNGKSCLLQTCLGNPLRHWGYKWSYTISFHYTTPATRTARVSTRGEYWVVSRLEKCSVHNVLYAVPRKCHVLDFLSHFLPLVRTSPSRLTSLPSTCSCAVSRPTSTYLPSTVLTPFRPPGYGHDALPPSGLTTQAQSSCGLRRALSTLETGGRNPSKFNNPPSRLLPRSVMVWSLDESNMILK